MDVRVVTRVNQRDALFHWVIIHGALEIEDGIFMCDRAATPCGIVIAERSTTVNIQGIDKPPYEPDCAKCVAWGELSEDNAVKEAMWILHGGT